MNAQQCVPPDLTGMVARPIFLRLRDAHENRRHKQMPPASAKLTGGS